MILSVLHHPRWPRQEQSHVTATDGFANKHHQCKCSSAFLHWQSLPHFRQTKKVAKQNWPTYLGSLADATANRIFFCIIVTTPKEPRQVSTDLANANRLRRLLRACYCQTFIMVINSMLQEATVTYFHPSLIFEGKACPVNSRAQQY
jgi:hypothetical protein